MTNSENEGKKSPIDIVTRKEKTLHADSMLGAMLQGIYEKMVCEGFTLKRNKLDLEEEEGHQKISDQVLILEKNGKKYMVGVTLTDTHFPGKGLSGETCNIKISDYTNVTIEGESARIAEWSHEIVETGKGKEAQLLHAKSESEFVVMGYFEGEQVGRNMSEEEKISFAIELIDTNIDKRETLKHMMKMHLEMMEKKDSEFGWEIGWNRGIAPELDWSDYTNPNIFLD